MAFTRLIILSLLCATGLTLPIDRQQVLGTVECDAVTTYTPEWFLRNTLSEYRREIHGKALFYTKGASSYARALACGSKDYVSLWQIWPAWLYDDRKTPDNPLRCIHNDHKQMRTFYENMSNAYARMARKHATVMHISSDYADSPQDGIWGRIELPALRDETDIVEVSKTNEKGSLYTMWPIPNKGAKTVADRAIEEVQRIFRSAKDAWTQSDGPATLDGEACTLWASKEDGYLDSLW